MPPASKSSSKQGEKYTTENVTIGPPARMSTEEGFAPQAEAAPVAIDFQARQDAISLKRRSGGPDVDPVAKKVKAKPSEVPPTEL
jgi:hypothetical protein